MLVLCSFTDVLFVCEIMYLHDFFSLWQLNKFQGTISVYQSNISNHKVDLKQAQYKDIDKRYFDQLIQLKV